MIKEIFTSIPQRVLATEAGDMAMHPKLETISNGPGRWEGELNGLRVNDGDIIVDYEDGSTLVFAPNIFKLRFTRSNETA